jgi:hypothetical protein
VTKRDATARIDFDATKLDAGELKSQVDALMTDFDKINDYRKEVGKDKINDYRKEVGKNGEWYDFGGEKTLEVKIE